ncbi:MAG: citrate synthase [Elusimicrobia bacterium]|nr:citrate synthase [Elusimicrobiota bacterium]
MGATKLAAKPGFSAGLEGVTAARSGLCSIDGQQGRLYYLGYSIEELTQHSSFEEVCFLLWRRRFPTAPELKALKKRFLECRALPEELAPHIERLPKDAAPMGVLRTLASLLGNLDKNPDNGVAANEERAVRMTAQFPTMMAAFHRLRRGQNAVAPHPSLDHAANFLYMLSGRQPTKDEARLMDVALILHADHEMNASTFSSLVTASTLSDLYSAVVSGIGTLKGPLHGGANEEVLKMIDAIGDASKVEAYVRESFRSKKYRIMGFGHRIYKTVDPRARVFKEYARNVVAGTDSERLFNINVRLEEVMQAQVGSKGIYANVDLYSGLVYQALGIPPDLFTPIFAIARVAGWTAHVLEYWQENRLFRPNAEYVGPEPRSYERVEKRRGDRSKI